jgi:hypothetical protein
MVRAVFLYGDEDAHALVIPTRTPPENVTAGQMRRRRTMKLLGATQGYDENGFAIRGSIPLEARMKIQPLFTAVAADGTEREYQGDEIIVPAEGLTLTWERIPSGSYQYCFGLTDLSGTVHYTDSVDISF